jgi:hypothetical protein
MLSSAFSFTRRIVGNMEIMITVDAHRFERVKGATHGACWNSGSPVYYYGDFESTYH